MILWFNCKISDIRLNPQPRYHLRNEDRFDVAKYSFASYVPLVPLCSQIIFNLELADAISGRETEMESWLKSIFPEDKLIINWFRCNNLEDWKNIQSVVNSIDDQTIFPAGNEDHIFLDSNIDIFKQAIDIVEKSDNMYTTFMTSHWHESIRAVHYFGAKKEGNFIFYANGIGNNDAIRLMKKDLFNWYVDQIKDPNMLIFRTEQWNQIVLPTNNMFVPTKEQFRHFDGYWHVNIGPEYATPLQIPNGFFEKNIVIKYGFEERDENAVNINPTKDTLYAEDGNGTDYRWCLEDIPMFWQPYISEIKIAQDLDYNSMKSSRDIDLVCQSRLEFNWPHFGVKFTSENYPPVEWLNPHMLSLEFTD